MGYALPRGKEGDEEAKQQAHEAGDGGDVLAHQNGIPTHGVAAVGAAPRIWPRAARRSRTPALGAKVIARAWVDPAFKKRLLKDTRAALLELDIDIGTIAEFATVENTPEVHNVIVCTLCSCYPKMLLGLPPAWYKSLAYRSRTVVDPRGVLGEFGLELPGEVELRVHDSTADLRYLVLPMRPKATRGWSEAALAAIVTRDCMIGTALPRVTAKAGPRRAQRAA